MSKKSMRCCRCRCRYLEPTDRGRCRVYLWIPVSGCVAGLFAALAYVLYAVPPYWFFVFTCVCAAVPAMGFVLAVGCTVRWIACSCDEREIAPLDALEIN